MAENVGSVEGFAGIGEEVLHNLELDLCELDCLTVLEKRSVAEIQNEIARMELLLEVVFGVSLSQRYAAVERVNSCQKLRGREGLCDVIVGAEHKSRNLVHLLSFCGEHNNAETSVFASEFLTYLESVDAREHYVENSDVKISAVLLVLSEGGFAAVSLDNLVARSLQVDYDEVADCGFILAYKYLFHFKNLR